MGGFERHEHRPQDNGSQCKKISCVCMGELKRSYNKKKMSGREMIKIPILDGHNDSLNMMFVPGENKRPFLQETDSGHIDLPRAKSGGLCGGLFSIFVPHPEQKGDFVSASQERPRFG
jgi:hypothetical protein